MVFKCKEGCSICCAGPVPVPRETFEKFKHLIIGEYDLWEAPHDEVVPHRESGCGFLKDGKCQIYDNRPKICQDYGQVKWIPCPYIKKNGRPRTLAGIKHTTRLINHQVDDAMKHLSKRCEG